MELANRKESLEAKEGGAPLEETGLTKEIHPCFLSYKEAKTILENVWFWKLHWDQELQTLPNRYRPSSPLKQIRTEFCRAPADYGGTSDLITCSHTTGTCRASLQCEHAYDESSVIGL